MSDTKRTAEPWTLLSSNPHCVQLPDRRWFTCPSEEIARQVVSDHNALANIPDPAAAIKLAREALGDAACFIRRNNPDTAAKCDAALAALNGNA